MRARLLALSAALAAVSLLAAACGDDGASDGDGEQTEGPFVVATVAPITDLVRQVMGDRGTLIGLVPPGVDSHTFEPRPGDARTFADADLFIANGLFLEEPSLELARANMAPGSTIITLADTTISEDEWAFDFSFPEDGGVPNPHLWLDVAFAMDYVRQITDALVAVDPDGKDLYRANADTYLAVLEELDTAIAIAVASIPEANRKLVTYHDSWPYFGRRYDIAVVGAVQPSDFSEPSAGEIRTIIGQVEAEAVPAVFGSEQFPSDVLRVIAEETGARYVEDLSDDELPGDPGDPDHSYIGMMVRNVHIMVEHLGGDPSLLDAADPRRS